MFFGPLTMNMYGAFPGALGPNQRVNVIGYVKYYNETTDEYYPAVNVPVEIWATDDQFVEMVYTDENGKFMVSVPLEVGQAIIIDILGQRFRAFIGYYHEAGDTASLGDFILESPP